MKLATTAQTAFAVFAELTEPQQEQLVHDAWLVGLRALHNAYSAA